MNPITFTKDEITLLQGLLKKRFDYYNESLNEQASNDNTGRKRFEKIYNKPLESALAKISSNEPATYNSYEKLSFISCINEQYDTYYNELKLPTALSWMTISDKQRKVICLLDNCKDILFKCGYFKKRDSCIRFDTEFRYSNILTVIEKLKHSERVFLSKVGQNDYYKIAFIYNNKEYLSFELKHQILLSDFIFIPLNEQSPDVIAKKRFSMITTKTKAKELIANCDGKYYPEGVLEFVNLLLE